MKVHVLRIGHRISRDHRISTHCGLVSRAFGAEGIVYSGEKDQKLLESVAGVARQWGGSFSVSYEKNWKKIINGFKRKGFIIVHLTMYGMPVQEEIGKMGKAGKILIVVGGEKVPWEVYDLADFNVSVTGQPHSEIAALSVFLDRLFGGKELSKRFPGGMRVVPQKKGKKVVRK